MGRTIALATLVAGTLDILFAMILTLIFGREIPAMLRTVASGPFPTATDMGTSGAILGLTSVVAAIPSFFLAYFLQILIIFIGGAAGRTVLPVFGFGLDGHLVLPLLALSAPAVAMTAQLTAVRMAEVFDADFVNTANAKGLLPSWIVRVHILPHVLPLSLEAVGSGLRIAVASLPIVEYLLLWNGIGFVALQWIALRDPAAFAACGVVLATLFSLASLLLDLRPRHLA